MAITNNKIADTPGYLTASVQDMEPIQLLVVAIFHRAILDLRSKTYKDDALRFAKSPWAQTLLGGAMQQPDIVQRFIEISASL